MNNQDEKYEYDGDLSDDIEKEQDDDSILLMEKPFDPTLIKIETKTPSLDTLIKRVRRESIQMDTSNYFQRNDDLWDKTKQSRLIESILIRFPLPAFFFDASDDNNWLIVDGLQRLSSIRNFVLNKQPLTNLEFLTHLNGLRNIESIQSYLTINGANLLQNINSIFIYSTITLNSVLRFS